MTIVRQIADTTEEQFKNVQKLARRSWLAALGLAGMTLDNTEKTYGKFIKRGEKTAAVARTEVKKLGQRLRREQSRLNEDVQDASETVERKVTDLLANFNVPTRRALRVLDTRISQLTHQLRELNADAAETAPIANYDDLNVEEVVALLPSLNLADLQALDLYETANQRRVTVLREVERQIAQRLTSNGKISEPFNGYDALRADDVAARLEGLTLAELRHIKLYESTHAKRVTVQREVERRIDAIVNKAAVA
jgi:polyhydroxyalkanoate synthesis regulator phasin